MSVPSIRVLLRCMATWRPRSAPPRNSRSTSRSARAATAIRSTTARRRTSSTPWGTCACSCATSASAKISRTICAPCCGSVNISAEVKMAGQAPYIPAGVIPAVLLPFNEDLSIDEPSLRSHLREVASVQGVSAITVNAHASEVASCTFDEQRRVLEITREELGKLPIVSGVYAEGSLEAARIGKMAHAGGASALLVFPSGIYTFGQRPEMAVEHFRRIA